MIDITNMLKPVIELAFTLLTLITTFCVKQYFIPWLKAKFSSQELETVESFIVSMIRAAEQLENNGSFGDVESYAKLKKEYVLNKVQEYCKEKGFCFSEEVISDLIEGLIKTVKYDD